jgi:spermidine dehydrogenase
MTTNRRDQELGMNRRITRRDFLNGVAVGVGGVMAPKSLFAGSASAEFAPEKAADYYPPALLGMRGNHDGTYTYAHSLRDGESPVDGAPTKTGEVYDLVVVGGGLSGLAAAYFYRRNYGKNAKILVLDNHDDFGGHAKRNEFKIGNRTLMGYGGTQSIESPGRYSPQAHALLVELGIDTSRFYKAYDEKLYPSLKLGTATFFDRETFGEDRLVPGLGSTPWAEYLAKCPLSDEVRKDIARVYTEKVDYFPGLSTEEKRAKLAKISYADFLTKVCRVHPDAVKFFQSYTNDLFCTGIDAVPALACYEEPDDYEGYAYAGFQGMDLDTEPPKKAEPYIFHFPDGNASIARLLVRSLIPAAVPGHTMEDVVETRADYSKLDIDGQPVRLRLNSTVVQVNPTVAGVGHEVDVTYMRGKQAWNVHAKHCVLACYNVMIPYICPALPEKQKESLSYLVKSPLIYTHVAIRNWTSFQKLGIRQIEAPGSYHTYAALDFPISLGEYKFPSNPEEPMVLFMLRTPCKPGESARDQFRMGRVELMSTPFSAFERNIRDQLGRMLGGAGFDPARDIAGITVNRWAHGYAFGPNPLFDPDWPEGQEPWVLGRKPFGPITIANSDAAAIAYTDAAIDMAYRAVNELPKS